MIRTSQWIIFCLIISLLTSSCSVFLPRDQTINIMTSEPKARVWVNGQYVGESPIQVNAPRNRSVGIMVEKEGFEPARRSIQYHLSFTGILDILGTFIFLLPAVGLMTPGAFSLDETDVSFNLLEKND